MCVPWCHDSTLYVHDTAAPPAGPPPVYLRSGSFGCSRSALRLLLLEQPGALLLRRQTVHRRAIVVASSASRVTRGAVAFAGRRCVGRVHLAPAAALGGHARRRNARRRRHRVAVRLLERRGVFGALRGRIVGDALVARRHVALIELPDSAREDWLGQLRVDHVVQLAHPLRQLLARLHRRRPEARHAPQVAIEMIATLVARIQILQRAEQIVRGVLKIGGRLVGIARGDVVEKMPRGIAKLLAPRLIGPWHRHRSLVVRNADVGRGGAKLGQFSFRFFVAIS
jgi:hypothetical protein